MFPAWLSEDGLDAEVEGARRIKLSTAANGVLEQMGASVKDLFHHVLATLRDPHYRAANAGALRMGWPRIPLPDWSNGESEGATLALARSAARGRELARLLNPDAPVSGVTDSTLRPAIATAAVPTTEDDRSMTGEDFAVTAGWGYSGSPNAVMPGHGRAVERGYKPCEAAALGDAAPMLGRTTFDIYLNQVAFLRNVPATVWTYKLDGYQILKKWLSYRERSILDRALTPQEVLDLVSIARRIAAILTVTGRSLPLRSPHGRLGIRT